MAKTSRKKIKLSFDKFLLLIFLIGLFLRTVNLASFPLEFHSREALIGWRAKSLLELGRDEMGRKWPFIFSTFDGYQLPLTTYILVPFVGLFGLNPFLVRLPFALIGSIAILALFGIVRFLLPRNKKMAYWSALILAINPWAVFLSRNTSSVNFSFSLFLIGFFFFLKTQKKKNWSNLTACLFITASLATDKVSWLFVLPILALTNFFFKKRNFQREIFLLVVVFIAILFLYLKTPQVKLDLFNQDISLLSDLSIKTGINAMRGENLQSGSAVLGRLFYNKLFYLIKWSGNYLSHFNPRFYFVSGDGQLHHGLTNFGPILAIFLPFTLAGISLMFRNDQKVLKFLLVWFLLAFLPSSLMTLSPNQEKAIFAFPVLAIISAYCLAKIKRKHLPLFFLVLVFNFSLVTYDALKKEPFRFQEERQIGYQKLARLMVNNIDDYQMIYLTDSYGSDPGPTLLFFLDYSPQDFLSEYESKLVYRHWINQIGKITINQKEKWESGGSVLYIVGAEEEKLIKSNGHKVKKIGMIKDLKNQPIFNIFTLEKNENEGQ